jgi:hypothetical protein
MGDIKTGDYEIGSDGTPKQVTGVYPQQGEREIVTVTFSDGVKVRCDWDHLWNVYSEHQRFKGLSPYTMSTRDILKKGLTKKNGKNGSMLKWSIPMTEPVEFSERQLSIEPYMFGVILGDGCTSENDGVVVCTDKSILETFNNITSIKDHETSTYTGYGYLKGIKPLLRDMSLLGKRSWEKHIPADYLHGSIDQRLSLLQGLLDTDGSPHKDGGVEFSSTSEQLTVGVIHLVQSLGGIARKKQRQTYHQNGAGRISWRVTLQLPSQFTPFRLERKLSRWVRPTKYQPMRKIKSIEVSSIEHAQCISVNTPDSLYITNGFVLTHNTPITLTTIVDRMRAGHVKKVLIFGPLRVIQAVWAREARKWEHTKHLRFSVLHGTKEKRERALFADADIYLCNYENMNWLTDKLLHYYISQGRELPFEMVVYDEVSKLKNSTSKRMKGGKRDRVDKWGNTVTIKVNGWKNIIPHFKYRTGLTGTPASNGYMDLHGQYLAVDGGKRLGEFITHFKDSYFVSDYNGWKYTPTDQGKKLIEEKISDITKKMDAKDYLDMPDMKVTNMMVDLPPSARKAYEDVEKDMFTRLDTGAEVEVFSKSSISNKCLQFCNGTPYYGETKKFEALHDAKLEALEDIIEEAGGRPVLCSYSFQSDAERIMKKFKKLNPVNMTQAKSADTEKIINKWNQGKIKLMIGHPACLHADTLVLTELRGWVRIIDVKDDERVFDGVEFVSHSGCSYSGYKDVMDVFGVTMTPNHKLMIDDEWIEAKDVRTIRDAKRKALYKYEGTDGRISKMLEMRNNVQNFETEFYKAQQNREEVLSTLCEGHVSQYDRNPNLANLVRSEEQGEGFKRQGLWWSWYNLMQRMGTIREFLHGYVTDVSRTFNNRTCRCKQGLLKGQLYMGNSVRSAIQQEKQSSNRVSRGINTLSRIMSTFRVKSNCTHHEIESGYERGPSCDRCNEFTLREKQSPEEQKATGCKKEHVYDLVDCGPRHRFLIKNPKGEVFISHNSMGHGVDGLQESGSILVWFGCNWSLELYEQMNGRLNRQGQTQPVSIIRILCNDTVDLAVADALERKTDDQEGLKAALQRYRNGITTNDLELNFY